MVEAVFRQSKLSIPAQDPMAVVRPRVLRALDQATLVPLTVVRAPTGYGKTSAVAMWAHSQKGLVAWYTLDPGDNELMVLCEGLERALTRVDPLLGSSLRSNIQSGAPLTPRVAAALLEEDLANSHQHITLVIDDLHLVSDPDIVAFLQEILRYPPPRLRVLVLTQAAVPINLSQMKQRGMVGEVGVSHLALADDEARIALQRWQADDLPDQLVDNLVAIADGWISALKMGALVARSSAAGFDSIRVDSAWPQRRIGETIDALCDELVAGWEPSFHRFMVGLAFAERVNQSLADAIAAEFADEMISTRRLQEICNSGLFLMPVDEASEWYRFHSLFRQALVRSAAIILSAEQSQRLHFRIAEWYSAAGGIEEAVFHYLAANSPDAAATLIATKVQEALAFDQWLQVERWFDQLPQNAVFAKRELLIARAWVLQSRGQHDALQGTLSAARLLANALEAAESRSLMAEVDLIQTLAMPLGGNGTGASEALGIYERAFHELQETGTFGELVAIQYYLVAQSRLDRDEASRLIHQMVVRNAGRNDVFSQLRLLWARIAELLVYGVVGHAAAMLDMSRAILALAVRLNSPRQTAFGQLLVASILYEIGELDEAERLFREAALSPYAGIRVLVGAESRLARTLDALGRTTEARQVLQQSLDRLLEMDAFDFVTTIRTTELRLAIQHGNAERADFLIRALGSRSQANFALEVEVPELAIALWMLQSNSPTGIDDAARILANFESDRLHVHWLASRIQILLVRALWHHRQGNIEESHDFTEQAVSLGEDANYHRVFHMGSAIEEMLRQFIDAREAWPYLGRILRRMESERRAVASPGIDTSSQVTSPANGSLDPIAVVDLVEPLTYRELDILSGLRARLSNKEIAEELSISPLTVKSHTRNIYGKLGVNGRRQAIQRAMSIGLLTQDGPPFSMK